MGKNRDPFKKTRYIKRIFHVAMGMIKDRNSKDLTEVEEINKMWQEYKELYKLDLNDPDNHDSVVTNLELDILECKIKWAFGSNTMTKLVKVNRIPAELFQIQKHDVVKVQQPMLANSKNSAVITGLEKVSFHSNPKERQCKRTLKLL